MQLPGFTAEISLNRQSNLRQAASPTTAQANRGVSPQLRIGGDPVNSCYSRCMLAGRSPLQCFFACGPGQLGGPAIFTLA